MAKLRDQLQSIADHRAAKAEIAVPQSVKEFDIRMRGIRELRDSQDRVYRVVGLLECRALVAGRTDPIELTMELSTGANWGVLGELEECIRPALNAFIDGAKTIFIGKLKAAETPLGDAPAPLPSDAPVKQTNVEKGRASKAGQERLNRLRGTNQQTTPPLTPPSDQFDEGSQPNPEKEEVNHAG